MTDALGETTVCSPASSAAIKTLISRGARRSRFSACRVTAATSPRFDDALRHSPRFVAGARVVSLSTRCPRRTPPLAPVRGASTPPRPRTRASPPPVFTRHRRELHEHRRDVIPARTSSREAPESPRASSSPRVRGFPAPGACRRAGRSRTRSRSVGAPWRWSWRAAAGGAGGQNKSESPGRPEGDYARRGSAPSFHFDDVLRRERGAVRRRAMRGDGRERLAQVRLRLLMPKSTRRTPTAADPLRRSTPTRPQRRRRGVAGRSRCGASFFAAGWRCCGSSGGGRHTMVWTVEYAKAGVMATPRGRVPSGDGRSLIRKVIFALLTALTAFCFSSGRRAQPACVAAVRLHAGTCGTTEHRITATRRPVLRLARVHRARGVRAERPPSTEASPCRSAAVSHGRARSCQVAGDATDCCAWRRTPHGALQVHGTGHGVQVTRSRR